MQPAVAFDEPTRLREEARHCAGQGDARRLLACLRGLLELSNQPSDYAFAAARLSSLPADAVREAGLKPLRTYMARSVTIETMLPYLRVRAALAGLWLELSVGGYGSFIDDLTNPDGALCHFNPDLVLFVSDLSDLAGGLQEAISDSPDGAGSATASSVRFVTGLLQSFRANSKARIVVQGMTLPDPPGSGDIADANLPFGESRSVEALNHALADACRRIGDAVYFDVDKLAARHGRARWRDPRIFYLSRLPIAPEFFEQYARGIVRAMRTLYFPARKVLCTDLDETLWGGILGEDGCQGIQTGTAFPGNAYQEYQQYLKRLSRQGILLAAVSKNNPADVQEAFQKRSLDLSIGWEDFVAVKIGWEEKTTALQELANDLCVGLDSFVFVDDSPVECAAVGQRFPEMLVVQATPGEPWRTIAELERSGAFDVLQVTDEDRGRAAEYRAQAERATLASAAGSRTEFLASLDIQCCVVNALEAPLNRTAQLLSKTNQFNLTTRRHSAAEIEMLAGQPGNIAVALRYRDRFGDGGVVGVALCIREADQCRIETFLLSCRVIGRGVETALLWFVAERAKAQGLSRLRGEYIPTAKNAPCAEFYPLHGFEPAAASDGPEGSLWFEFDLTKCLPKKPSWIRISTL